jgi:bifunctional non-homologous end joining protein LigD
MLEMLLDSPAYMAQEKKDGERRLIGKIGSTVTGINQKGEEVGLPEGIAQEIRKFECDLVVDGEQIGEIFWMFDVLECEGEDLRKRSAKERYQIALGLCAVTLWPVQIVQAAFDKVGKRNLLNQIRACKGEGIVLKNCDAPYTVGRPNSGGSQLKYKFTSTATCRVVERNGDKRSVQLGVTDGVAAVGIGNVAIPANFTIPRAEQIVEVRYLYAYKGGSLYQPVYLGVRKDHAVDQLDTLKFKADNLVEDDDA